MQNALRRRTQLPVPCKNSTLTKTTDSPILGSSGCRSASPDTRRDAGRCVADAAPLPPRLHPGLPLRSSAALSTSLVPEAVSCYAQQCFSVQLLLLPDYPGGTNEVCPCAPCMSFGSFQHIFHEVRAFLLDQKAQ